MKVFQFIFYLGIAFSVFNFLWFLFKMMLKSLNPSEDSTAFTYLLKIVNYFIISVLTVAVASEFILLDLSPNSIYLYSIIGGIILYFSLSGKLERNKMMMQFQTNVNALKPQQNLKNEMYFIVGALFVYGFSFVFPVLADNSFVHWLYRVIRNVYETPLIGWVFGFIGVVFLLNMMTRSMVATTKLLNVIMGRDSFADGQNKSKVNYDRDADDEGFVDYEEVEDDEDVDNNRKDIDLT